MKAIAAIIMTIRVGKFDGSSAGSSTIGWQSSGQFSKVSGQGQSSPRHTISWQILSPQRSSQNICCGGVC